MRQNAGYVAEPFPASSPSVKWPCVVIPESEATKCALAVIPVKRACTWRGWQACRCRRVPP